MRISPIFDQFVDANKTIPLVFHPTVTHHKMPYIWSSQALIAELYQITKQTTGHHVRSIFDEKELSLYATVRQYLTVQTEGTRTARRTIEYHNLDMILAMGYRVPQ